MKIDEKRALEHLLDLLAVEGPSGREKKVAELISRKFKAAGAKAAWIRTDEAHKKIGMGFETGNLIIKFPGTVKAPRIMFSAHMDTVPLCKGAVPVVKGRRVVSKGDTGLGGDDRAACAAMVTLAEKLLKEKIPHPPITFLFVVGEEGGLFGSRHVKFSDLGRPAMGFNLDGEDPDVLYIGAMGAYRWECQVTGKSAHAGLNPEKGISAGMIAALALAEVKEKGWFGKVEKGTRKGTSNVGVLEGGEATNQVMDKLTVKGECRSHNAKFLEQIMQGYEKAFDNALKKVTDENGRGGKVKFIRHRDYKSFRLKKSEPCVKTAAQALKAAGAEPKFIVVDAGLDANNFNEKGFPCVTLGAGTHNFHNVDEYVDIAQYNQCCRTLLEIVKLCG